MVLRPANITAKSHQSYKLSEEKETTAVKYIKNQIAIVLGNRRVEFAGSSPEVKKKNKAISTSHKRRG